MCRQRKRRTHERPAKRVPLARLAAFICEIEAQELFPVKMDKASAEMYRRVARHANDDEMADHLRCIAAEELGWQKMIGDKEYAKLHTTISFTMASGSEAANVIPQEASVVCNIRVSPGDTVNGVLAALEHIAKRHKVELEILYSNEASPITDPDGEAFHFVEAAAKKVWPQYEVIPVLLSGCTDSKHFTDVCPNCLRFTAMHVSAAQMASVHGIDENVDVSTLAECVDFFKTLISSLK